MRTYREQNFLIIALSRHLRLWGVSRKRLGNRFVASLNWLIEVNQETYSMIAFPRFLANFSSDLSVFVLAFFGEKLLDLITLEQLPKSFSPTARNIKKTPRKRSYTIRYNKHIHLSPLRDQSYIKLLMLTLLYTINLCCVNRKKLNVCCRYRFFRLPELIFFKT